MDYTSLAGYQDVLKKRLDSVLNQANADDRNKGWGYQEAQQGGATNALNQASQQFSSQFQNLVGRAPTEEELNTFYNQYLGQQNNFLVNATNQSGVNMNDPMYRQGLQSFIGDTYQQAAKDYANQQLTAQQTEASRLADLYRKQGQSSISQVEGRLQDFQSRLFEKLRPQLITSLQAQGLLNTGGLNEAMAGAQKDLASEASNALTDAYMQNENAANQIAFGGASAPYMYQQAQTLNQVPYLQNQAQNAMNVGLQNWFNNDQYNKQLGLMAYQNQLMQDSQPGLLGRLGQNFVTSFGQSAGSGWGNTLNPYGQSQMFKNLMPSSSSSLSAMAGM